MPSTVPDDQKLTFVIGGDSTDFENIMLRVDKRAKEVLESITNDTTAAAERVAKTSAMASDYARDMSKSRLQAADVALKTSIQEAKIRGESEERMKKMVETWDKAAAAPQMGRLYWIHQVHAGMQDLESMAYRANLTLGKHSEVLHSVTSGILGLTSAAQHLTHLASYADLIQRLGGLPGAGGGAHKVASAADTALDVASAAGGAAQVGKATSGVAGAGWLAQLTGGTITGAAGAAAAALATFTAAVSATTYAIGGMDAVKEIPTNLWEGSKMALKAATLGYLDFTQATKDVADAEKALAEQQANNQARIAEIMEGRKNLYSDVAKAIKEMGDLSSKAETKTIDKAIEDACKLGINVSAATEGVIAGNIQGMFGRERASRLRSELEDKADKAGKSEAELQLEIAAKGTKADYDRIVVLQQRIKWAEEEK